SARAKAVLINIGFRFIIISLTGSMWVMPQGFAARWGFSLFVRLIIAMLLFIFNNNVSNFLYIFLVTKKRPPKGDLFNKPVIS
ncbi:MAG TPA: hypothetical protein DEP50_01390, partial [Acinetobacter lwoffii]|nr:hypothetical protein [Acinetobacter lwoffii]